MTRANAYRLALIALLASAACAGDGRKGNDSNPSAGIDGHAASNTTGGSGGATHTGSGGGGSGGGGSGGGGSGGVPASGAGGGVHDAAIADASAHEDSGSDAAIDGGHDGGSGALPNQHCLDDITDYVARGPFDFDTSVIANGKVKVWVPDVPAGCTLPVVHFANGMAATCSAYVDALEHLASHGFLTTCYESMQTGEGTQCIDAVESVYAAYPALASTQHVGFTGSCTGGGAAYVCAHRAEQKWGDTKRIASHAVPPDVAGLLDGWEELYAQVDTPVFVMNGSIDGMPSDGVISEAAVRMMYEAFNDTVEAYWYEGVDARHIPAPTAFIAESAVAWFRWQLLGDTAACEHVKALPDGEHWNLQEQQNASACE